MKWIYKKIWWGCCNRLTKYSANKTYYGDLRYGNRDDELYVVNFYWYIKFLKLTHYFYEKAFKQKAPSLSSCIQKNGTNKTN